VDAVVMGIMRKVLTNEAAASYSWSGGKKKEILSKLNLSEVISSKYVFLVII
jgi:hypothetical protein